MSRCEPIARVQHISGFTFDVDAVEPSDWHPEGTVMVTLRDQTGRRRAPGLVLHPDLIRELVAALTARLSDGPRHD